MFLIKKHILYISPTTITVALAGSSADSKKRPTGKPIPWTNDTLAKTLLDIKKDFSGPFDVLLDDDLAFVLAIAIPSDTEHERELVRIRMAETVPQTIGDAGWDFKEMLENAERKEKLVQCVSVEEVFYNNFSIAVGKTDIAIEAMEPVVCSLARLLAEHPDPELVIYAGEKTLVFMAYRGLVFSTLSFDGEPDPVDVMTFLDFIKEKFSITPKTIVLAGKFDHLSDTTKEFSGYAVESADLDMFLAMARKSDIEGKDALSLNILPVVAVKSGTSKLEEKIVGTAEMSVEAGVATQYTAIGDAGKDDRYPQGKLFTLLILAASFFIIMANGIILYQRMQVDRIIKAPSPLIAAPVAIPEVATTTVATTTEPTSTAIIAPVQAVNKAEYAIAILNGNGKKGVTQTLKTVLEAQGFRVVKTGNADTFSYQQTTVRYKNSVSDPFRKALEQELSIGYTIQQGSGLTPDDKVDVMIIIGK